MLRAGNLSHLIKELKQNSGKEQPKTAKKGETTGKDKALDILMVQPWERNQLVPATTPLIGFSGEIIWPIGQIQLLVRIGDEEHSASAWMNFVVVRSPSPYNGIIGRLGVRKLLAVPSTAHEIMKLKVEGGVITLKAAGWFRWNARWSPDQKRPLRLPNQWDVLRLGKRKEGKQRIEIKQYRKKLESSCRGRNNEGIHYHDWLSNPMMVKKHDDSWRMCVDFKDLNKACLKDGYPLPEID
ncbi:hypothetical protein Tco_1472395 [Tanacetum coccineum]